METNNIKEIIVTVLLSGALFSFLQFLITRNDNKKNIKGEIEKKMDEGFKEIKADVRDVKADVRVVSERLEEHKATLARTHILRFADELRTGSHSKEYFEQQLQDIDTYNNYCSTHPKFVNEMAKMAIRVIRKRYEETYNDTD